MTEAMTPSLRLLSSHSEHGSESDGRLDGRIRRGVDLVEAMDLAGSERRLSADTNDLHGLAGQGGRPALSSVDSPSPDNRVGLSQAIQPYQEPWRPPSETDRRPFSLPNGGADLSLIVSAQQMTFEVFKSVEHLKQVGLLPQDWMKRARTDVCASGTVLRKTNDIVLRLRRG
jgi:hypothetical protein